MTCSGLSRSRASGEAHVYGNNWGRWVTLATVLVRLAGWYGTERRLAQSARLIMRAAELDMRGRKTGFMLHLRMRGDAAGPAPERGQDVVP